MKTTTWSEHLYHWWFVWVLCWEIDLAVVVTTFIRTISETEDDVVPFEQVIRLWNSYKVLEILALSQSDILFGESFVTN